MDGVHLRKFGVSTTVDFALYEIDGVDLRKNAFVETADIFLMKDEGAEANASNSATDEGRTYSLVLTATELQAARLEIIVEDQSVPKVYLDKTIMIETYGNASAQHAIDLDDSVRAGLTALPNVAAGSAGGLPDDTDANGAVRIVDGTGARELNTNSGAVALVDLVTTTTTNSDMRGTDGVDTATMRGTDNAALASVATEARLAELDAANLPATTDATLVDTAEIGVAGVGLGDLGGMSTAMKAEILVEVNAALDTAISELAQVAPTATPTMRTGLMLLYMALRNRLDVNTSGTDELQIFNDAGTVIAKKLLTDDGSDYSESKQVSGP